MLKACGVEEQLRRFCLQARWSHSRMAFRPSASAHTRNQVFFAVQLEGFRAQYRRKSRVALHRRPVSALAEMDRFYRWRKLIPGFHCLRRKSSPRGGTPVVPPGWSPRSCGRPKEPVSPLRRRSADQLAGVDKLCGCSELSWKAGENAILCSGGLWPPLLLPGEQFAAAVTELSSGESSAKIV